jgi:hypothetical protein
MTREEQIEQLQFEQDMDDIVGVDITDEEDNEDRHCQLTEEMDYYPEDEFDRDQRNAEFQMVDALDDTSDN